MSITVQQTAVEVNNNRTELVCTQYQDRIFIVVTQFNKIGTLVRVFAKGVL